MYLELDKVKKHLNIDSTFTEDDSYIKDLIDVSETVVAKHIDKDLSVLAEDNGGELPSPLSQAILLFIGNMYANRESVSSINQNEIPNSYNYLLDLYKY